MYYGNILDALYLYYGRIVVALRKNFWGIIDVFFNDYGRMMEGLTKAEKGSTPQTTRKRKTKLTLSGRQRTRKWGGLDPPTGSHNTSDQRG